MNVLDLFSGIGGFSLGLERAGMRTVAFCEIDGWRRGHLARRWPGIPIFGDIRTVTADQLPAIDLICGGFPCQDISVAGKGKGLEGSRSGLWFEMLRIVRECRPDWVLIENSPRLRVLGADRVLGALEEIEYTGRPFVVAARHTGASHQRKRVWIIANANSLQLRQQPGRSGRASREGSLFTRTDGEARAPTNADRFAAKRPSVAWLQRSAWPDEPPVLGVDDGIPDWLDRKRALGDTVVPQIPEILGRAIMRARMGEESAL